LLSTFLDSLDNLTAEARKDINSSSSVLDLWMGFVGPALVNAFEECDKTACSQDDSGATATVVFVVAQPLAEALTCGIDAPEAYVICANVGDSHAFLYTGVQTLRLNADHRLDANKAECERVRKTGSTIDNQETRSERGPSRLYPGGLMMSRTIGDRSAPAAIPTPEVRIAYLPPSGGRVVIASDGLWDITTGKQAAKLVHVKPPQPAGQLLVTTAQRKDSRDDITVRYWLCRKQVWLLLSQTSSL
jgi:serine/threonine protein phosphatase PrpC